MARPDYLVLTEAKGRPTVAISCGRRVCTEDWQRWRKSQPCLCCSGGEFPSGGDAWSGFVCLLAFICMFLFEFSVVQMLSRLPG